MDTIEEFYEAAAERFTPGGPGRVDWYMTDAEIVEMLRVTNPGFQKTGALFVVPTPAGIVAIKPISADIRDIEPVPAELELEDELREGRHYRGWRWSPGCNALNRANLPQRIAESFR